MGRKHNNQGYKIPSNYVCKNCREDDCPNCVDVLRVVYTDDLICKCKRKKHMGEAVDEQIADPFDGSVVGPAAQVSKEGDVTFSDGFREWWRNQFGSTRD